MAAAAASMHLTGGEFVVLFPAAINKGYTGFAKTIYNSHLRMITEPPVVDWFLDKAISGSCSYARAGFQP
jgi:hypothetical protein